MSAFFCFASIASCRVRPSRCSRRTAPHHGAGHQSFAIFKDDQDRTRFLERLGETVTAAQCAVHAWVLMDNHVHLSILCDDETYLLALVRYIHLNPLRAKIITTLEQLDQYPWTGHRTIVGKDKCAWMDVGTVLSQYGDKKRRAITAYRQFVHDGVGEGKNAMSSGGGLIKSRGGWSQVLAMRRKGEKQEADERILGSGDFVHAILKEADDRHLRQIKIRRSGRTLEKIIDEECKEAGISSKELHNGSRRSAVSAARGRIAWRGREELGMPAAEMARYLGVATSSITRTISRQEGRGFKQRK